MKRKAPENPGKVDLTACTHFGNSVTRNYYSADFIPLGWEDDITARDDLFLFEGTIFLRYKRKPFPPFHICVHDRWLCAIEYTGMWGWDDFLEKCKEDKRFDWIRRATDISPRHFDIAAENYGAHIPICVDIIKYYNECGGDTRVTTKGVMDEVLRQKAAYRAAKRNRGKLLTMPPSPEEDNEDDH